MAPKLPWGFQQAYIDGLSTDYMSAYRQLQKLATSLDITEFITYGDCGFIQGSVSDRSIFPKYARDKSWAAAYMSLFGAYLNNGGTYLDIGGNIGLTTIPVAQNKAVKCHVFEPNPVNFRLLTANINANCHNKNVTTHQIALFDRDDILSFEVSPTNSGDNRIRMTNQPGTLKEESWHTVKVDAMPLDNVLSGYDTPLIAKIDTQGAEPFIIAGGKQTLAEAQLLSIEFWPYGMARMGGDYKIVIDFLRKNFRYGSINMGDSNLVQNWRPIESIVDELEKYARHANDSAAYLDVIACKYIVNCPDNR